MPSDFVRREREVNGFSLDNVPRASLLSSSALPAAIPVLFHGSKRDRAFEEPIVSLPLAALLNRRTGNLRYKSAVALTQKFQLMEGARIVLTGTDQDGPIERWWALGSRRIELIRQMRLLGIGMVTTPNYSLFVDKPRWDDLHSMKRIAITHEEFLREGIPSALHVNARTQRDWERWAEYINSREEVQYVAFEFATGAGRRGRKEWYLAQLIELARNCDRSLHLIVRAVSPGELARLARAFNGVTVLDTNTFMKTVKRRQATAGMDGKVSWTACNTHADEPLDDLLEQNWLVVRELYNNRVV